MPRVAGVNIPEDKQIRIALTYIYGIGPSSGEQILERAGVDPQTEASELSNEDLNEIKKIIEDDYKVEGELKREKKMNVKRLKEIECWRGIRHKRGLPVRGQTTQTNSRTVRGNERKTVGSGSKATPRTKK
ncbi:30S ribosomal protein S13 [candidate division MSBL1 archaeon SCGC-AAA382N08]|uniref:Small ribosomal subunit protein uS13 n=1 Tax=candidate division MSBL1 archaeon SCGC-AAA382N08 TaxID=1698285 RepID=A0A133VQW7_9EURY|nr:30S ribosomal protein S13 [candidate division MSBL1 archaeon SCGC-AAA382N08]